MRVYMCACGRAGGGDGFVPSIAGDLAELSTRAERGKDISIPAASGGRGKRVEHSSCVCPL